jgi:hypothetical protein
MGELDRFSGVPTMAGQGRQCDRLRPQRDGVIGGHNALVVQAETAGQIEAAGQAAEVAGGSGTGEALIVIGAEACEHNVGARIWLALGGTAEAEPFLKPTKSYSANLRDMH